MRGFAQPLTGIRTGEIDGFKWKYVDFGRRLILIRETVVNGREDYTKTDASQRHIQISGWSPSAEGTGESKQGSVTVRLLHPPGRSPGPQQRHQRVCYPLLRHLGLKARRPYQTRHAAATLWLAARENPEWIARQTGHATTETLFQVYSRYVPNLTRQDGSAMRRLLTAHGLTEEEQ
jgi:integrase